MAACGGAPTSAPATSPAGPERLGTRITYEVWGADGAAAPAATAEATRATLEARAKAVDSGATVALSADGHLVLDTLGPLMPEQLRGLLARASFGVVPLPPDRFGTLETPGVEMALAGEPLPAGLTPLLTIADVDPSGVSLGTDDSGQRAVTLVLLPAGAQRLAAWSADHVGEFVALDVNGIVVSVPVVMTPLVDGAIVVSGAGDGWPTEVDLPALRGDFPPGVRIVEVSVERIPVP